MATLSRQPFAPLDGARLQRLTSVKNKQNAVSMTAPVKRKASDVVEDDDFENVDPSLFSKRSKGSADRFFPSKDSCKPSSFVLTKVPSSAKDASFSALALAPAPLAAAPKPRAFLNPKSPTARLNTSLAKASPLSAPAGRSPTRGNKRVGILSNRRRTAGPFSRVDPPAFELGGGSGAAPFSLDAALQGTIPTYKPSRSLAPKRALSAKLDLATSLHEPEPRAGWFFDIHEDTPEQEMTNLLQHSTCVLDISSDEESEQKARREKAEGRDKENIPPPNDVSQTSRRAVPVDEMMYEKQRNPLAEMNVADYYAAGYDERSVVIVPGDDEDGETVVGERERVESARRFELAPDAAVPGAEQPQPVGLDVDELMHSRREEPAQKAAVLEPMEGTGESFELWESNSAKGETDAAAPAAY